MKERKNFYGTGIDISKNCINISKINAINLKLTSRLKLYKSDVDKFNLGKYDLIVSNPPYINTCKIKYLERDIVEFEPRLALDGGLDGLSEIRKVIKKTSELIKKNGKFILEIGFDHKDELLAKSFNENLVSIVNNFYFKTKTQKTGENLQILQRQADSVKKVLDKSILFLAEKDQSIPNPNPLTKVSLVPYQKALVDVQANGAIYQEIVTQLELAKVTHRNKTPLIQIIDKPTLPLENSRLRFFECIVYEKALSYFNIINKLCFFSRYSC